MTFRGEPVQEYTRWTLLVSCVSGLWKVRAHAFENAVLGAMVGAKRNYPFEYVGRGPAKVQKEDTQSIYEATLNKLKHGALASLRTRVRLGEQHAGKNSGHNEGANRQTENRAGVAKAADSMETLIGVQIPSEDDQEMYPCCYVCSSSSTSTTCCHCTRACCGTCSRTCDGCQGLFCSICCTANYDERNDRSFCFECESGRASVVLAPVYSDRDQLALASSRFRQSTLDYLFCSNTTQRAEDDRSCSMDIM